MTLIEAQTQFRQSPTQETALAYLDAAIAAWELTWLDTPQWAGDLDHELHAAATEVRAWLTIRVAA